MEFEKKLILVVDDMVTSFVALQKKFKSYPFEFIHELDSRNVLETTIRSNPDLILMDFEMPEVNGPTACRLLKQNIQTSHIPIFFVTSLTSEDKIAEAFDAGAEDYLLKPVHVKEFISKFHRILTNIELTRKNQLQYEAQVMLIRTMSHDLVSMMAITNTDLKQMFKLTDDISLPDTLRIQFKKHCERAARAVDRAIALIHNVRELQQLEDEKKEIVVENVLLQKQFDEAIEMLAERIHSKNINIKINSPKDTIVFVNPSAFSISVIGNILSNAIKFSQPNGEVHISTEILDDQILIRIKDNGVGIPKAILEKLFIKGAKTSRMGTQREMGTGFGMLIANRYMNFFKGKIIVNSWDINEDPINHGTCIDLYLPKPMSNQLSS